MPIVGTAGHVDHGKSTLVIALTGRDPDRWDEEKARGLTIDLGFAWADLGDGTEVGFVDVPGHERFIKNMLAGVGALDVAMLVVAADEGWMPQTEEHLAVLDLLEVGHGVIAVTRIDLVDDDVLELAQLEIHEAVDGTRLSTWPLIPVSAPHRRGLDELARALREQLAAAPTPDDRRRPRLWVDRAFTITGAGAVVTGTLTGGEVRIGDELELWPGPRRVRVRGIQSHEAEADAIGPGRRAALNLGGIDHREIDRGACLAEVGALRATQKLLVSLRPVRGIDDPLTDRGAYQVHIGSGAWPARLRMLAEAQHDAAGAALIVLDRDLPAQVGDRLILRDVGRRAIVGGGRVLDPRPTAKMAALRETVPLLAAMPEASVDDRAQVLLDVRGRHDLAGLAAESGGGVPRVGFFTESDAVSTETGDRLQAAARDRIIDYQAANPLRPGLPRAELLSSLGVTTEMLGVLLADDPDLVDDGATVRTADFSGGWGPGENRRFEAAAEQLREARLAVPRASQLGLPPELLHAAVRSGRLVRIADDLVYLPEQIDEITAGLPTLESFTVAEFRDAYHISRRQAVPLLEWLDAAGWTVRRGDLRTVRPQPPPPAPGAPPP